MNPDSESTSLHPDDSHSAECSETENFPDNTGSSSSFICADEKEGNVSMNPDSECTSLHPDDSHSAEFSKSKNFPDNGGSSLSSFCTDEKRNAEKIYRVEFVDYNRVLGCTSEGQETILNMVQRRLKKADVKNLQPKIRKILFMKNRYDCLNVGLPTGSLSTEDVYICKFKKDATFNTGDYLRQYAVDKYNSNWEMGHLFLSKDRLPSVVSHFLRFVDILRVDFFSDETVFEALIRDGRFVEEKVRFCSGKCEGVQLNLSHRASHYQGKYIELCRMTNEDTDLPKYIPPRPHPDDDMTNVKTSIIKQEVDSPTAGSSTDVASAARTPVTANKPLKSPLSTEYFADLIEDALEIKPKECIIKNRKKLGQLARQGDLKLKNFALEQGFSAYICQLEELAEIATSVGAVFILNEVKFPKLVGTCFRMGTQYIITNNHVCDMIPIETDVFIDFNFKKGESPSERRFLIDGVVARSEGLDYAILRMKEASSELPPSIFSHDISIMDPTHFQWSLLEGQCVTLIGHPHGRPKQTDLVCPVVTKPLDSAAVYVHALRRGWEEGQAQKACLESKDQRRGTYLVSTFFKGSSGSPGIVFQNGKKKLVILHTKGYYLGDPNRTVLEQGVLLTEIYKDAKNCIKDALLRDIFPSVDEMQTNSMNIDQSQ